jgi:hypothetical protein
VMQSVDRAGRFRIRSLRTAGVGDYPRWSPFLPS